MSDDASPMPRQKRRDKELGMMFKCRGRSVGNPMYNEGLARPNLPHCSRIHVGHLMARIEKTTGYVLHSTKRHTLHGTSILALFQPLQATHDRGGIYDASAQFENCTTPTSAYRYPLLLWDSKYPTLSRRFSPRSPTDLTVHKP